MKLEFKNLSYNDVQKKFNYIQEVYDKSDNDSQLEIDFCKLNWTEPIGMLFFGAKLREFSRNNPEVEITLGNIGQDSGYFEWMGLYDYFIPDSKIGKKVGHVFGNTNYIPITKINVKAEYGESFKNGNIYADRGEFIEVRANQLAQIVTSDRQLEKILTYIIREIIRNVPEHSGIDEFWICGQAWHGKLKMKVRESLTVLHLIFSIGEKLNQILRRYNQQYNLEFLRHLKEVVPIVNLMMFGLIQDMDYT